MQIQVIFPAGLNVDANIRHEISVWVNERYTQTLAMYAKHRVQLMSGKYCGHTGKVVAVAFLLNAANNEPFQCKVNLDWDGIFVDDVPASALGWSTLTDSKVEVIRQERKAEKDKQVALKQKLQAKFGKRPLEDDQAAVNKLVRVINAERFPEFFLKEGVITRVLCSGKGRCYDIKFANGRVIGGVEESEVAFL